MKVNKVYVVFDGTSHFILPKEEVTVDHEIICICDIDTAEDVCENLNEQSKDN